MPIILLPIRGGEGIVTGFAGVERGHLKVLFLLVGLSSIEDEMQQTLMQHLGGFGEMLEDKGAVIHPYPSRALHAWREVVEKPWPDADLVEHMKRVTSPFLLILDEDFGTFDPGIHRWAIVWLQKYDPSDLARLLRVLAQEVLWDRDVFRYVERIARKRKIGGLMRFIKLKTPDMFGVAVDLGAFVDAWAQGI